MSYGKILGRLVVTRRGTPRKGTRSGECVYCKVVVCSGEVHPLLLRTVKSKKTSKLFWVTRRFHIECFPKWLDSIYGKLPEMEAKSRAGRAAHRPRPVLSRLNAGELVRRNQMVKRRSYLINRILAEPFMYKVHKKKEDLELEIKYLSWEVHKLAPGINFLTEKRKVAYHKYLEEGGKELDITFDSTPERNPYFAIPI